MEEPAPGGGLVGQALEDPHVAAEGVPGEDDVAGGRRGAAVGAGVDEDLLAVEECGVHAAADDAHAQSSAEPPREAVAESPGGDRLSWRCSR